MEVNTSVKFFLDLAQVQAVLTRRFDSGLGGLGQSEFMILLALSQSEGESMRRIDLAERIGLTASGVTRLLAPMEKVGLIKREANAEDARVSSVMLAKGGKQKLEEALERAEVLAEDVLPGGSGKKVKEFSEFLLEMKRNVR